MSWEQICNSKTSGGMGLRRFAYFNMTMLAKQEWKFLATTSSPCSIYLKTNIFPPLHSLKLNWGITLVTHGELFGKLGRFWIANFVKE